MERVEKDKSVWQVTYVKVPIELWKLAKEHERKEGTPVSFQVYRGLEMYLKEKGLMP